MSSNRGFLSLAQTCRNILEAVWKLPGLVHMHSTCRKSPNHDKVDFIKKLESTQPNTKGLQGCGSAKTTHVGETLVSSGLRSAISHFQCFSVCEANQQSVYLCFLSFFFLFSSLFGTCLPSLTLCLLFPHFLLTPKGKKEVSVSRRFILAPSSWEGGRKISQVTWVPVVAL